ncbi:related to transcription factor IIIB [Rhynchosporium secalis]|uniref:B-related factor 1 n=1 Tax=Rhynchosporium secalis TaxID=38038 RepID=A0A1E1LYE2_RHYSE|nr:related to transcription factor IIIB [Rhynchosporium secalis]
MAPPAKPKPVRKANPLKNRAPVKAPPPTLVRQAAAGAAAAARAAAATPAKRACPNKECSMPTVVDGICHNCGFIVEESTIVSEVTFGENSSGAAVVQGSYVSADQSGARSIGPAFKRAGGGEDREATIRDGRRQMQSMGAQLQVSEPTIAAGVQIFKLAAMSNFIQGRRTDMVCAVCLYSACRKYKPCKVMLIDFADLVQTNVFKLGHTFKKLHEAVTIAKEGIQPVLPEELIFRFAQRLEFGPLMTKVAEDAIRMVQRMSMDWMVMGRRPSGVCGACLILAARMNNFRRTITEVVYIVKVTTHTIQKRLEEFKQTPSSALTVEEFLHNEFLESAHDPPSFYEKTEEFQKTKKRRKRKGHDGIDQEREGEGEVDGGEGSPSEHGESESPNPDKRQKPASSEEATSTSGGVSESQIDPSLRTTTAPDQPAAPVVELRRDADGFVIPPRPIQSHDIPIDPALMADAIEDQSGTSLERLNEEYNDTMTSVEEEDGDDDVDISALTSTPASKKRKRVPKGINVPPEWSEEEAILEKQISEMISDPNTINLAKNYAQGIPASERTSGSITVHDAILEDTEDYADDSHTDETMFDPSTSHHEESYAQAEERVAERMKADELKNPSRVICMDVDIGEDEFEDDPEVANCLLSAADSSRKEKVWVNHNKDWLRKQQLKLWAKKEAENGPPKARRNRKKKPRIGEGQTSAASSPGEAAVNALKLRAFSKKINYDAIHSLFSDGPNKRSDKNALGSAGTSRITSRAASEVDDSDNESITSAALSISDSISSPVMGESITMIKTAEPRNSRAARARAKARAAKAAAAAEAEAANKVVEDDDEDEDMDDDDYIKPVAAGPAPTEEDEEEDWRSSLKKSQTPAAQGEDQEDDEDMEDYDDLGGIEPGGLGDYDGDNTVYGDEDEEEDYGADEYE